MVELVDHSCDVVATCLDGRCCTLTVHIDCYMSIDHNQGQIQEFALGGHALSCPLPFRSRVPLKVARGSGGAL